MGSHQKRVQTVQERYQVTNVAQLAEVQTKRRQTFESKRTTIMFYQEPCVNQLDGSSLTVFKLDNHYANEWLQSHHPFGAPRGNVLSLGLVRDNEVYCMMTFKKDYTRKHTAELSRLWTLPTYDVIGGYDILSEEASKLGVESTIAYVNMSFENYHDYESIGMKHVRDNQRTKWWIRDDQRMSDASRRQYKLKQEDLITDGWLPVFDLGQRVYEFVC